MLAEDPHELPQLAEVRAVLDRGPFPLDESDERLAGLVVLGVADHGLDAAAGPDVGPDFAELLIAEADEFLAAAVTGEGAVVVEGFGEPALLLTPLGEEFEVQAVAAVGLF